jgi:protein associated with RNAse G/E
VKQVYVHATHYDGSDHWRHAAYLVRAEAELIVTRTAAGLVVARDADGTYTSPFNTRGHYWTHRWYNVLRLEEPDGTLNGFYCNVATPARFDGETLRYIDLQLDVRVFADESGGLRYEVLDEDDFAAARDRYAYPEDVVAQALGAVDEVIGLIKARAFPFEA